MPTATYLPTRTPISLPEGARHLDAIPFGYHFLTPPEDTPKGRLLVYLDAEKSQINYLTWQGETGPLLRIDRSFWPTAESAPPLAPDELWLMPVGGGRRHIVLGLEMPLSKMNERIYVIFDLIQRQAWALSASCEADSYLLADQVGPYSLTYQCFANAEPSINVVPLDDSSTSFTGVVPVRRDHFPYLIHWLGTDELLLVAGGDTYCFTGLQHWRAHCRQTPYFLAGPGPGGRFIEVRDKGAFETPARIGTLPVECLRGLGPTCEPAWIQVRGVIRGMEAGDTWLDAGVWTSDGAGLIFLEVDAFSEPGPIHPTTPWYLDVATGQLQALRSIPLTSLGHPAVSRLLGPYAPIWSPDGNWLLLEEADAPWDAPTTTYLMSKETGELRVLLERGGPVLGELVVP